MAAAAHPGWHLWHLQPWSGAVAPEGIGRRSCRQVGSVVQLLSLADDAVVVTTHLNPFLVFGQGGKGECSLPLEDCCQIGHQL